MSKEKLCNNCEYWQKDLGTYCFNGLSKTESNDGFCHFEILKIYKSNNDFCHNFKEKQ